MPMNVAVADNILYTFVRIVDTDTIQARNQQTSRHNNSDDGGGDDDDNNKIVDYSLQIKSAFEW